MLSNPVACQLRSYGFYCETTFLANSVICRGENEKDEMLFLEDFCRIIMGYVDLLTKKKRNLVQ